MTKEEKAAYSRGYNAGRKRSKKDLEEFRAKIKREIMSQSKLDDIFDKYFCAALTGVLASDRTWSTFLSNGQMFSFKIIGNIHEVKNGNS